MPPTCAHADRLPCAKWLLSFPISTQVAFEDLTGDSQGRWCWTVAVCVWATSGERSACGLSAGCAHSDKDLQQPSQPAPFPPVPKNAQALPPPALTIPPPLCAQPRAHWMLRAASGSVPQNTPKAELVPPFSSPASQPLLELSHSLDPCLLRCQTMWVITNQVLFPKIVHMCYSAANVDSNLTSGPLARTYKRRMWQFHCSTEILNTR